MYLGIFNDNWADEMDICGFRLFTPQEKQMFETLCRVMPDDLIENQEFYIGSNEELTYNTFGELFGCWDFNFITNNEAVTIVKNIGSRFGSYIDAKDVIENMPEDIKSYLQSLNTDDAKQLMDFYGDIL